MVGGTVSRWLVALGSVVAAVGFTLLGIATSYVQAVDSMVTLGVVMMVGGVIALIVGLIGDKAAERAHGSPREPGG